MNPKQALNIFPEASLDVIVWLASEHRANRLPPTLQAVFDEICELFDLTPEEIRCSRKLREHVIFRQLFSYVASILTRSSLQRIGEFLGGYDHSTISNHRSDVQNWIDSDDEVFRGIWKYYSTESKIWRKYNEL